jgi:DNA-binding LytR/AlgR family response regulator
VKLLLLLTALLLFGLAEPARACVQPASTPCDLRADFSPGGSRVIEATVTVPAGALPLERPLTVRIAALASSELFWNGSLVGRNGAPANDAGIEQPGRYFVSFTVPASLVRPGENQVWIRLSAEHLWLPVERPIHLLTVGLYETPALPGRTWYLPALLALGALTAVFAYFAFSAVHLPRFHPSALLLPGIAAACMLQLGAEVSRAFVEYSYPWYLGRLFAIAVLAMVTAVLVGAYAAERFVPERRAMIVAATAVASFVTLLLPSFDLKAISALSVAFVTLGACGLIGSRRGASGAGLAAAVSIAALLLIAWQPASFLDRTYYLLMAAFLVALVAQQVKALQAARAGISRLEARLRDAEAAGEPIVSLKHGARVYRVVRSDILFARAADDYCHVHLKDGHDILVTTTLGRLLLLLPETLVRVHKSYAVSRAEVVAVQPRSGSGRQIMLKDGSVVPVGRSFCKGGELEGAFAPVQAASKAY